MRYKKQEARDKKEISGYLRQGMPLEQTIPWGVSTKESIAWAIQKAFKGVNDKFQLNLDPHTINAVAQKIADLTNIMTVDNAIEIYSYFVNAYIFSFGRVKTPRGVSDQQVLYAVSNLNLVERDGYYVIGRDSWEDLYKKRPVREHWHRSSIIERYEKIPEWLRWILFFPLGMAFSFAIGWLMALGHLDPSGVIGMIGFLFALHALVPKFKNHFVVGSIVFQMVLSIIMFLLVFTSRKVVDSTIVEMCVDIMLLWAFSWCFYFWILRKTER